MATTRAKFDCVGVNLARSAVTNPELEATNYAAKKEEAEERGIPLTVGFDQPTVVLRPVMATDDSPENRAFWEASPNGSIELTINNPAAAEVFELGKSYYVDFTPADD